MKKIIILFFVLFTFCFGLKSKANDFYHITNGNDDYYYCQQGRAPTTYYYDTPTLYTQDIEIVSPPLICYTHLNIDTSTIPEGFDIVSATLYFYSHSYTTVPKTLSKTYDVFLENYGLISNDKVYSVGWQSVDLSSDQLSYINKNGTTNFYFKVPISAPTQSHTYQMRAYEYDTPSTYSAYLDIKIQLSDNNTPNLFVGTGDSDNIYFDASLLYWFMGVIIVLLVIWYLKK